MLSDWFTSYFGSYVPLSEYEGFASIDWGYIGSVAFGLIALCGFFSLIREVLNKL